MQSLSSKGMSKFVLSAVLCALAIGLSLIDTAITIPMLPGIKLGLASIVSMFALYALGLSYALTICVIRSILTAFLSGGITMLLFSLLGGIFSILVMMMFKKRLSIIKVSVLGALTHNIVQSLVAVFITSTVQVGYYLPLLLITGAISGFCMGLICNILLQRIKLF